MPGTNQRRGHDSDIGAVSGVDHADRHRTALGPLRRINRYAETQAAPGFQYSGKDLNSRPSGYEPESGALPTRNGDVGLAPVSHVSHQRLGELCSPDAGALHLTVE